MRIAKNKEFSNEVFRIKFETDEPFPIFGAKYYFQLDEVVNCPEFLVHFPVLEKLEFCLIQNSSILIRIITH